MITSDAALQAVLRIAIAHAIDDVFTWAENKLIQSIHQAGAAVHGGGLDVAWVKEVHGMFGQLRYDPMRMAHDITRGIHASPYDNSYSKDNGAWDDVRDIFIEIIQGGYRAWNAHTGRPIAPRPFWDKFIGDFENQFPRKFRAALRKQGLVVL